MSQIGTFNKSNVALLKADVNKALAEVGAKYGITFPSVDIRCARDGSFARLYKMDIQNPAFMKQMQERFAAHGVTPEQMARVMGGESAGEALKAAMQRHGITRMQNAKGDRLTGYNPRAPKFCFQYTSARGTEWNTTAAQAKQRFG